MFNRKVNRDIRRLINEGKTRQEVFTLLVDKREEYGVTKDKLKRLVRNTPTIYSRIKYRFWHNLLMGLILLLAIISLLFGYSMYMEHKIPAFLILLFPLVEIIFFLELLYYRGGAYLGIGIVIVYQLIKNSTRMDFSPEIAPYTIGIIVIMLVIAAIAFYLYSVMCSAMKEFIIDVDFQGQKRKAVEERFVDPIAKDEDSDILL